MKVLFLPLGLFVALVTVSLPLHAEVPNDATHSFFSYIKNNQQGSDAAAPTAGAEDVLEGPLLTTMNAAGYTYMEIAAGKDKVWLATRQVAVKKGDIIAFPKNEPFTDFHSKTLNRTFPSIYFVAAVAINGTVVDTSADEPGATAAAPRKDDKALASKPAAVAKDKKDAAVTKLSLAKLLSRRRDLHGKSVSVHGRVVKVNTGIMGRNWVHIVDDSLNAKTQDVTITTQDSAAVGDRVEATGVVAADKDIGSGYSFPVLVEEASLRPTAK